MEKKGHQQEEGENFSIDDVLKVFWLFQTQNDRLDFLLDKERCSDEALREMLKNSEFVLFLFRNSKFTEKLDDRISLILAISNEEIGIAAALPVAHNIASLYRDGIMRLVKIEVRARVFDLILETREDVLLMVCAESGESLSGIFNGLDLNNVPNIILESGDAELAGEFGLLLVGSDKLESAKFYLQRAVDLGAKKYQVDLAIVLFQLAVKDHVNFNRDCFLAWQRIESLANNDYDKLIACARLNKDFLLFCLSNLNQFLLNKVCEKLNKINLINKLELGGNSSLPN